MKFALIRTSEYFTFSKQIFHSVAISLAYMVNFVEKIRLHLQSDFSCERAVKRCVKVGKNSKKYTN